MTGLALLPRADAGPEVNPCKPVNTAAIAHLAINESMGDPEQRMSEGIDERLTLIKANPDLNPQQLANKYLETKATQTNRPKLKLELSSDLFAPDWDPAKDKGYSSEKQGLIAKVALFWDVLSEFQDGLLDALDVDTIHVEKLNKIGGYFSDSNDSVGAEFGSVDDEMGQAKKNLRQIITHEVLGHAAHARYCRGDIQADSDLAAHTGDFKYIGLFDADWPQEEIDNHYKRVPTELTAYGPSRAFTEAYGASNSAEHFATIVAFTLEKRGLIMPGDDDHGSPLYEAQQIIVNRLEMLLPGFKQLVEARTQLLRRDPKNEIYTGQARNIAIPPEIIPFAVGLDADELFQSFYFDTPETVPVLNGAFFQPDDAERGGTLYAYPAIHVDPEGNIVFIDSGAGTHTVMSPSSQYFEGKLTGDVVQMPWDDFTKLTKRTSVVSPEADAFFAANPRIVNLHPQP